MACSNISTRLPAASATAPPEPLGGAHRDPAAAIRALGDALDEALGALAHRDAAVLRQERREKFLAMGRL